MDKRTLNLIQQAAIKGRMEGILFGFDIFAICLNHRYGFGDKRLTVLDGDLQEIIDELKTAKDWDRVMADIAKELCRIRKGDNSKILERLINL
jgi:hypothetical protein